MPPRGGWCRGGSQYVCWGVVRNLTLETKQFQRFLVSWFQNFKVSKIPKTISCFLEDLDFMLTQCHFMFPGRYRSHIQDFQEMLGRTFRILRHVSFPTFPRCPISKISRVPKTIFGKMRSFFLYVFQYPGVSKDGSYWFRGPWTHPGIRTSWKLKVFGSSHNEIEKLRIPSEAE